MFQNAQNMMKGNQAPNPNYFPGNTQQFQQPKLSEVQQFIAKLDALKKQADEQYKSGEYKKSSETYLDAIFEIESVGSVGFKQ